MDALVSKLRHDFHTACLSGPITQTKGIVSIADSSSPASLEISSAIVRKIGKIKDLPKKPQGQTAGRLFEEACRDFIEAALRKLDHLRPGGLVVQPGNAISKYEQFSHLSEIAEIAEQSRALKTHLGSDYLIKPDIIVERPPQPDAIINEREILVDDRVAQLTSLRSANGAGPTLHASISCKLTIRSDRVQNTRSEALNLVRNRKGRLPHIVAVTAEPTPNRIAAIALGTGDIDCVYHFALPELLETVREQKRETLELVETMVEGKRLRDIADLPFDLAI